MTAKVLVADDSLTIQKVIGITLASSGYELVECLNEVDLFRFLQTTRFDLVLLDFNLSDKRTGYELSRQIKEVCPDVPIMIMLGTFDSVEDSQLAECGISDKVVKPFESGKFIKKCKDLIEKNPLPTSKPQEIKTQTEVEEVHKEDSFSFDDKVDQWIVDAPDIQKETRAEKESVKEVTTPAPYTPDPLESELAGWSMDAGVDLEKKYNKVFPPVIESRHEVNVLSRFQESSVFLSDEQEEEKKEEVSHEEVTQPVFEIPLDLNQQLITEIDEDLSPDSFWAVDDVVSLELDESKEIKETHLDKVVAAPIKEEAVSKIAPINQDEIVEKLKISLRPIIEELVKEYCRQSAEKVAWEVIPDLAENLIRKELKEISESL